MIRSVHGTGRQYLCIDLPLRSGRARVIDCQSDVWRFAAPFRRQSGSTRRGRVDARSAHERRGAGGQPGRARRACTSVCSQQRRNLGTRLEQRPQSGRLLQPRNARQRDVGVVCGDRDHCCGDGAGRLASYGRDRRQRHPVRERPGRRGAPVRAVAVSGSPPFAGVAATDGHEPLLRLLRASRPRTLGSCISRSLPRNHPPALARPASRAPRSSPCCSVAGALRTAPARRKRRWRAQSRSRGRTRRRQ